MIKINDQELKLDKFNDGTFSFALKAKGTQCTITWAYDSNEELLALEFIVKHLRSLRVNYIDLIMPYVPNARMDRKVYPEDVFTLKYFCDIINSMEFNNVFVLDTHSNVTPALLNNVEEITARNNIKNVYERVGTSPILYFPDEGARSKYTKLDITKPYLFGTKNRDWKTHEVLETKVIGDRALLVNSDVLIVDDICGKGDTIYKSASLLKSLGAKNIYVYVSHCENTVLKGTLLDDDLITLLYTTDSIYRGNHKKIKLIQKYC